eukprot:scaffold22839_cov19-Tisochrysis_lutea.AAC.1
MPLGQAGPLTEQKTKVGRGNSPDINWPHDILLQNKVSTSVADGCEGAWSKWRRIPSAYESLVLNSGLRLRPPVFDQKKYCACSNKNRQESGVASGITCNNRKASAESERKADTIKK